MGGGGEGRDPTEVLQYKVNTLLTGRIGLGISDKKIIPRKTEYTEEMVISEGISVVPRNPSTEEEITRNSVPRNKNRSKLNNSVPNLSAEENKTRNSVPNHSAEENTT